MTLTNNKMIREIGRRTRPKNRDVQKMLESLIEVWTEELIRGRWIELENFFVIDIKSVTCQNQNRLIQFNRMPPSSTRNYPSV
jgi:nucleoid DNA-binding protein